ncbi:MAG TPA: ADP-ribosylglycohydrolase family protein [Desulfobaccales bacterium]|nr:ADP-ribosylglycohydrolase family protein [Desulfobaccales bacterium]
MPVKKTELWGKYLGGLLGSALGDAIGELAFRFSEESRLRGAIAAAPLLRYTDDTAMALGLAESLAERRDLDPGHLGQTFHRHFNREPWRGYASGPPTIFQMVEKSGGTYEEAAQHLFGGQGSLGNGAAMRVAPLGLFFHDSRDLYDKAAASAAVTHAHPLAQDGAAIQAGAVALAVKLDPSKPFSQDAFLRRMQGLARTPELKEKLSLLRALLKSRVPGPQAAKVLGQSVMIHESLPFALYAFLSWPHSFEDCLLGAVLHGGDRDTLGAMAGAVSGAYLGAAGLPALWREKLENLDLIEKAALALLV